MDAREFEKPGIYENLSEEGYNAIRALRSSDMADYLESDLHFRYMRNHPRERESDPLKLGSATHTLTLQPHLFPLHFCLEPDLEKFGRNKPSAAMLKEDPMAQGEMSKSPRSTQRYKQETERLEITGRTVLKQDLWDKTHQMSKALLANDVIGDKIKNARCRELTIVWEREGQLCKARLDIVGAQEITDIKTTLDLNGFSPWQFQKYRIYRQMAWYHEGGLASGLFPPGVDVTCYLAVVGNYGAFDTMISKVSTEAMTLGKFENDWIWNRHRTATLKKHWGSKFSGVQEATITDNWYNKVMEELG